MKNIIITISREYGSGGRIIGYQLAKRLEIAFYDRQLIDLIAHKSGLSKDYISEWDEKLSSRFVWQPPIAKGALGQGLRAQNYYSNEDKMFATQSDIIRELAEKEPCVIIGRCADYILRENANCMRIFIHADMDTRLERIIEHYEIDSSNTEKDVATTDKGRAAYHKHFTGMKWGDYHGYHMSIDSGAFGLENAVDILSNAARNFRMYRD